MRLCVVGERGEGLDLGSLFVEFILIIIRIRYSVFNIIIELWL